MLTRTRSQSPGKSPKDRDTRRRSLNIKLKSEVDYSNVSDSFADPIMQQIQASIPTQIPKEGKLNSDNRTDVALHFEDVLLPEEWLELEPLYLCPPPSLETAEFQELLEVIGNMWSDVMWCDVM
jgi:hypothetical protein